MATPKIDAYFTWLRTSGFDLSPEQLARHIGGDPKLCEERLRDAATFYVPEYRRLFKGALFVASEKRLYASDGLHLLEYRLRDDPNVTLQITRTNATGWAAVAIHQTIPSKSCVYYVGSDIVPPSTFAERRPGAEGKVVCDPY